MDFDIIIIGSGPGGYVAAIRASQLGLKTAIVEKEELGGICLNWGCIPTKALLKSAQVFEYIQHAQEYGITIHDYKLNFTDVINRSRDTANNMSKGIQFLMKKNKITVINGFAELTNNKTVKVIDSNKKEKTYSANHIIISTGARSRELPNLKQNGKNIIGYREALTLKSLPKSMIIVGSGAIGVEFAYFYNAMGTKVTIVEYLPEIVPNEDHDVSKELAKNLKKKGVTILTESTVTNIEGKNSESTVTIKTQKGEEKIQAEIILSAVGITPNIENIGLEGLKIAKNNGRITVNEYYQTNIEGYYAIGDVIEGPALAHVASAEGIICVEKIAGHNPDPIDYNNIPGCTYCSPEIASVGFTEKAALEKGYELKIGKFPFSASGKASAAGHKEGFVKVIYDAKYGELLGAHMIGYNVTEMIAEIVAARKLETTGHEILKSVHPHPTMSEAVMEATAAAYGEVIHL
ncbi:MAG: dihydrolipoyl dehydrogenase [Flavobacteriales bacterium]|nr:dihydrolipoyl dehydrogenase [Flavobacteriales bacterium]